MATHRFSKFLLLLSASFGFAAKIPKEDVAACFSNGGGYLLSLVRDSQR